MKGEEIMKKLLSFLLLIMTVLSLVACSAKVPEGMTKETYECMSKVLKLSKEYQKGDIEEYEFIASLDELQEEQSIITRNIEEKAKYDSLNDKEKVQFIEAHVFDNLAPLQVEIVKLGIQNNTATIDELISELEEFLEGKK